MGFTAFDGNELYAGSADPQFGAAVDGDIRLEAAHVGDVVPFAEEWLVEEGRTTGCPGHLLCVVIPCVELQPRIQPTEICVSPEVVPVRMSDEDGRQFR